MATFFLSDAPAQPAASGGAPLSAAAPVPSRRPIRVSTVQNLKERAALKSMLVGLATGVPVAMAPIALPLPEDEPAPAPADVPRRLDGLGPAPSRRPVRASTVLNLKERAALQALLVGLVSGAPAAVSAPAIAPGRHVRRSTTMPYLLAPNGGPASPENALPKPASVSPEESDHVMEALNEVHASPEVVSSQVTFPDFFPRVVGMPTSLSRPTSLPRRRTSMSLRTRAAEPAKPLDDVMEGAARVMG